MIVTKGTASQYLNSWLWLAALEKEAETLVANLTEFTFQVKKKQNKKPPYTKVCTNVICIQTYTSQEMTGWMILDL